MRRREPGGPRRRPVRSPVLRIVVLVAGALILSGVSWVAGTVAAGRSGAPSTVTVPTPSLVTARVEDRVVVTSITGRAALAHTDVTVVNGPAKGGRITALPARPGADVTEGMVLVEVDGRPTIALVGEVPMYRPLILGISGPDVAAFEAALERLGIERGPVDGTFDAATEAGVAELFRRAGYEPEAATPEQRAAYSAAQEAVTQARLAVLTGEHEVELDARGPAADEVAALLQGVADADRAVGKARRDAAALPGTLDAEIDAAATAERTARDQLAAAGERLASLPDGADAATRSQLEVVRAQASATAASAASTADALRVARPGRLADALDAVVGAQTMADVRRTALAAASTSEDRDLLRRKLAMSRDALASAEARLADQAAIVGAGVGVTEVAFFPSLPRRVRSVEGEVGGDAAGELLRVTGGDAVGRWFVSADEREQLQVGGSVQLSDATIGLQVDGTIESIASTPGDPDAVDSAAAGSTPAAAGSGTGGGESSSRANRFLVTIAIVRGDRTPPDDELVGRDLLVSAPVSESHRGLAVPVAALTSRSDGGAVVRKATGRFDAVDVRVTIGATGNGYASVVPDIAGTLAVDDRVVVGR